MTQIIVAAFYKFFAFPDYAAWREPLRDLCAEQGVRGTILLAAEGINSTIAGPPAGIAAVLGRLRADPRMADLAWKEAGAESMPFARIKVRLKREIVTLGVPTVDPNRHVGQYVAADDWNGLISQPDVVVVDTRNDYEVEIGSFQGALNPRTESFREFPEWAEANLDPRQHRRVAMYCTGGIRCEKATAYLLDRGFSEVYHLEGGILKYLETVPAEESLWQGECFVFDERVSVDHDLRPGSYVLDQPTGRPRKADAE